MKKIALFFLLVCCTLGGNATTFSTVTDGSWTDPAVWLNGQVPPFHFYDTVLVHNNLMYNVAIHTDGPAYLWVDSTGSLCGHRKFFVDTNSVFVNYGELYADSIFVFGGLVQNYGHALLSQLAVIGNGGTWANYGWMTVGGNFLCTEKPNSIAETVEDTTTLDLFPCPLTSGGTLYISNYTPGAAYQLSLYGANGELVTTIASEASAFTLNGIAPGFYIAVLFRDKSYFGSSRLIIE